MQFSRHQSPRFEIEDALLQVDQYQKAYDKTLAVESLSFEAHPGTIMGMVGPNGAGKTTTMRAIAGIIAPTNGKILVNGFDVVAQPKMAKQIVAFIPDDPKLFETLTVWEHLRFIAAAYQVQNFEPIAEELIETFELVDKRSSLARELSRGMRQKVAICCAYLQQPKLIMFDEPHTGLDPLAIRRMKSTIQARASEGAVVIVSSHLLSLIEDLCTHLLILSKGRSQFCGTLEKLRQGYPELETGTPLEEIFFKATIGETDPDSNKPNKESTSK
jgi:ABC-2 type transport system ATP-binding protein